METAREKKTLILNGSPRKNGDTAALLRILDRELAGEKRTVDCYRADIAPCVDCRACRKAKRCVIDDAMQEIYRYAEDCDNVVVASPVYFSGLTGKLLDVASRFQVYYSARVFLGADPGLRSKRGGVILAGGGDGRPDGAFVTAKLLLRQLNAREIFPLVCSRNTNALPAAEDAEAAAGVRELAAFLNAGIR